MRLRQGSILTTAIFIAIGVGLPACARTAEELTPPPPATVESIPGSDVARVTLTSDAAHRLDVQTAPVLEIRRDGGLRLVIPYAAVLYDPTGGTWTYTSPQSLVFVRVPIDVDRILGDEAVLSSGPEAGTEVVIVGTAELWGTENQVGEE